MFGSGGIAINDILSDLYRWLGDRAILIPLPLGHKKLVRDNWQTISFEQTQEAAYQDELRAAVERGGNIAVRLTGDIVSVDIDADEVVGLFTKISIFAGTLRTRGERGCNFWFRPIAPYPNGQNVYKLKLGGNDVGEWRCGPGAYTVIFGEHPHSTPENPIHYQCLVEREAFRIPFSELPWPKELTLPWVKQKPSKPPSPAVPVSGGDLHRRISAYMSKISPSIEGQGGDNQLFNAARALVIDWGLNQEDALPYLRDFNARCEPPWREDRLLYKLREADEKGQGERGHLRGSEPIHQTQREREPSVPKDNGAPPLDFSIYNDAGSNFPAPMAAAAFHGLAGRITDVIAIQSEACREAILIQLLCGVGNLVGRTGYAFGGDSIHHARIWCIVVGATSKGRKGEAWKAARRLLERIDPKWAQTRITSGASSGEGIIHNVRDAKYGPPKPSRRSRVEQDPQEEVLLDAGEHDKRLFLLEEEFAQIFRIIERPGNTLSCVLRQAWDGGQLNIPNKNSAEKAIDSHISVVGHITKEELERFIRSPELFNGFANRFLWCASARAQINPESEGTDWTAHAPILEELSKVLETFKPGAQSRRLQRNKAAKELWAERYEKLSTGHDGILGGVLNRAEAQVLRLSMAYCILDNSTLISAEHLQAALAVWDYSVRSAKWIFGDSTGDRNADQILWALKREKTMTRMDIQNRVFQRHATRVEIEQALSRLVKNGLAFPSEGKNEKGNPAEIWNLAQTP